MSSLAQYLEEHMLECTIKSWTGVDCPGCGLQRSAISLLKGDIGASLQYHPALIPVILLFSFTALHLLFNFRNGGKILIWGYVFTVAVMMVNYVLKLCAIIPGHP